MIHRRGFALGGRSVALCLALVLAATPVRAGDGEPGRADSKSNPLRNVYFGEQHLHTHDSPDAYIWYTPDPKLVKKAGAYPHLHQIFK